MTINLTDPTNHPANGPLTVDRIIRVRDALQRSIQYQNGGDMAYVIADAIKGLEELLVSREAACEPVAYTDPRALSNFEARSATREWMWARSDSGLIPLYTAQAIPDGWALVPVELTQDMRAAWDSAPNTDDDDHDMQAAYRAMIAAAPQEVKS
ncbi:hypothetical protein [Kluyvera cryocrescens]|uniref:hypothetical protein n=1 Tax=Kluyvera cryocrescens TaxID=580 RepID=UPI002DB6EE6B|nr:hypothetical protein [Kluyvera cryocrescens]MEB6632759.1 hypothetical protein [Kluyvera cryocrescens]